MNMEQNSHLNRSIVEALANRFDITTNFGLKRLEQIVESSKSKDVLDNLIGFLPKGTTKDEIIKSIEEALATVKRRWTELYPAVNIDPNAILRNKIIKFIGSKDKCRCTREEYNDFCNQLQEDEEIGRTPSRSWLSKNTHLVKRIKIGNTPYLKLTPVGMRVYSYICKDQEGVNENLKIDLNLPVKWDRLDDYRENERIGGIEFRPPVHNAPDAPPAAVDVPAGVGESAEILNPKELKQFNDWIKDGNASKLGEDEWVEQTTQWRKKFTYDELQRFFKREYLTEMSGSEMFDRSLIVEENEEDQEDNGGDDHNQPIDPALLDSELNVHFGEGDNDFSFVIDRMLVKVQSTSDDTPPEEINLADGTALKLKSYSPDIKVSTYVISTPVDEATFAGQSEEYWKDHNFTNWQKARQAIDYFLTQSWLTDDIYKKAAKVRDMWDKVQSDLSKMPIQEAANEQIYFDSLGSALDAAVDRTESRGYEVDKDSLFFHLGTGGIGYEENKSASIPLEKNGKPQRKMLQISIYRMPSGKYELTTYIN